MHSKTLLAKLYRAQDKVLAFNHAAATALKRGSSSLKLLHLNSSLQSLDLCHHLSPSKRIEKALKNIYYISERFDLSDQPFQYSNQKKNKKKGENSKDCWEVFFLM